MFWADTLGSKAILGQIEEWHGRYGERWDEEDGIPSYYGRNDYHPGARDYEWVEEHGDRDERVPIGQGYQLYYALERRGIPVRMQVFPGQGHGISDLRLQLEAARTNLDWFARMLR